MDDLLPPTASLLVEQSIPLTGTEFTIWFEATVCREQEDIETQMAGGARFIRSKLGGIHDATCHTIGMPATRQGVYDRIATDQDDLWRHRTQYGLPPIPQMLTAEKVQR
jgi:hypothetical protein